MNKLEHLIKEIIAGHGPMTIETYMNFALWHPAHGYYATKMPLGEGGDFITAPEISQMFGELVGLWCVAVWHAMGAPAPFCLAELGPGRGTLMADALRAAKIAPDFLAALDLHLIETSEVLAEHQRAALAASGLTPTWHGTAADLPAGPAIIIANEFFDCLPVRQFVRGAAGWHERLIGLDADGHLCFGLAPDPEPSLEAFGMPGQTLERSFAAVHVMADLAARLAAQGGALLVLDYGYDGPAWGDSLQAVRRHGFADPLRDPGEADLTAHVDFRSLAQAAQRAGAMVHGPLPQGEWLARLGLYERAAALRRKADARQSAAIDAALIRLAGDPENTAGKAGMGRLFKVLAVSAPGLGVLPGFETGEAA